MLPGGGEIARGGPVERGRYYFSVKVRLRSQVTTRACISMETKRDGQLKFQLGINY